MKNKRGITLIALIITIIVMLVLVTVTLTLTIGDNGIIGKARKTAFEQDIAQYREELALYVGNAKAEKMLKNEEYVETTEWDYETIVNNGYIPSLDEKYKGRIGIEKDELKFLDTGDKMSELAEGVKGLELKSTKATIKVSILGAGDVQGIETDAEISTKVGKTYNLQAIPQTIEATEESTNQETNLAYTFKGWYKGNELLSTDANYSLKVEGDAEYTAKFALEGYNVFTYTDGTIKVNTKTTLSGYANTETLKKLETMDKVTIKDSAFYNTGIKNLIIGDDCSLSIASFSNCTNLETVTIGNNANIGKNCTDGAKVFNNCTNLKNVTIGKNMKIIEREKIFAGSTKLETGEDGASITIESISQIPSNNLQGVKALKGTVVIEEGTTKIGDSAFSGCTGITSVAISSTVTNINESAFNGCTGITSVNINMSETEFKNVSGYTNLLNAIPKDANVTYK